MLRIGFSKKFFTLWNVTEKKVWAEVDGLELPFQKITTQFIKNLSSDEGTAKRKAIFEGVENFEIDYGLRGVKFIKEKIIDLDELFFEFQHTRKKSIKEILLQHGFADQNGQIVYPEHSKKIKLRELVRNEIADKTEIEVKIISNLNEENEFRFAIKNEVFHGFLIGNSKGLKYQGHEFYLPVINGKAKRIKNKKAKLSVGKLNADVYQIKSIEIL